MVNKTYCDKCQKELEEYHSNPEFMIHHRNVEKWDGKIYFDLCKTCAGEFDKLIEKFKNDRN